MDQNCVVARNRKQVASFGVARDFDPGSKIAHTLFPRIELTKSRQALRLEPFVLLIECLISQRDQSGQL